MDKENVILISQWNYVVCRKMDGTRDHRVELDMLPSLEREILALGVVIMPVILAAQEKRAWKDHSLSPAGQKLNKTSISISKLSVVAPFKKKKEKEILYIFTHVRNLDLKINNDMIVKRGLFWGGTNSGRGKRGVLRDEYDQNTLYVCMKIE
jgi:hypothetical protein